MTSSLNVIIGCKLTRINPVNSLQAVYLFHPFKIKLAKRIRWQPLQFQGLTKAPPPPPLVVSLCQPSYDKLCWEELERDYKSELNPNLSQRTLLFHHLQSPVTRQPGEAARSAGWILIEKQIILVKPHRESIQVTVQASSSGPVWGGLIVDSNLERGAWLCVF